MRTKIHMLLMVGMLAGCNGNGTQEEPWVRNYQFRAIGGVSMGAMTAAQVGLRFHEKFDILLPSGGALDLSMLIHWFKDGMLGGFCIPPEVGRMCRDPDKYQDYEHMECGGPSGGGFDRESMIETFGDMFIAYGNLASFNPEHPYLPAGIGADYLELSKPEKCQNPVRLEGHYDWEYNPDGTYPVITFCEADGPEQCVFDPSVEPRHPVEVALAVDLNDNGIRDSGEPVLFRMSERYEDVGEDGILSPQEPGYNAQSNPDPAGDDYHLLDNASGTEGNHAYDEGEPYLDYGLDGVEGTADSPYDWGEGNFHFDYNPHVLRTAVMFDPTRLLKNLSRRELSRLDFYIDVGIRDHLGFKFSCEAFVGILQDVGRPVDFRHRYTSLLDPDWEGAYDIRHIDWRHIGRDLFVYYGDPDATPGEIDSGDGGHVGNGAQVLYRLWTMIAYASARWPLGDFDKVEPYSKAQVLDKTYYSEILGEDRQYYVYLPPGYDQDTHKRYPVLYLMHGIGMDAEVMTASALFTEPWMNEGAIQKFIMIFPDGRCGDDCFSGTFFANQMGRDKPPRRYEDSLIQELMPHVDQTYRTRPPLDLPQ
jgi:hypothetical protein